MERSRDKTREEGSEHKRKEGKGQGKTSRKRALRLRACRLAVLFWWHLLRLKGKRSEGKRKRRKRSEDKRKIKRHVKRSRRKDQGKGQRAEKNRG